MLLVDCVRSLFTVHIKTSLIIKYILKHLRLRMNVIKEIVVAGVELRNCVCTPALLKVHFLAKYKIMIMIGEIHAYTKLVLIKAEN